MLYTLVGNGKANDTEVIATLMSLRDAVGAKDPTDEFWMAFQDVGAPSPTVQAILLWLNNSGIIYEVVVPEERDPYPEYEKADTFHSARRPLDMLLKLTKGRLQPGEQSAILVLSDELDTDNVALYAIERAINEDIPVYDLAGQMVPIVLEEDVYGTTVEHQEGITVEPPTDDPALNKFRQEADALPDTQMHEAAVLEGASPYPLEGETPSEYLDRLDESQRREIAQEHKGEVVEGSGVPLEPVPLQTTPAPLSYTRDDLEALTRDELKALVKTQGVTPTDMREKASMIDALMEKGGQQITMEINLDPEEGEKIRAARERAGSFMDDIEPLVPHAVYLLRIAPGGEHIDFQYVPKDKVPLIDTLLADGE